QCFGVLSAVEPTRSFSGDDLRMLQLIAAICAPNLEIARLSRLTVIDPLTGALNRRGLERVYPTSSGTDRSETVTDPLSIVMADIDHFKTVNDDYGHAVGDEVLRHVVRRLGNTVRGHDEVVRLGGEEFLLVLQDVSLRGALAVAE